MIGKGTEVTIGTRSFDFKELFDAYYPGVVRQAFFLVGERAAAEDLAQEVFLKLYNRPPRELTNLPGWLNKVATNLSINFLTGEKRHLRRVRRERLTGDHIYEADFDRGAEVEEIRQALDRLSERDRVCLLLRFSGHSYEELAGALSIKKSSVGTILARAQQRFREAYLRERSGHELL